MEVIKKLRSWDYKNGNILITGNSSNTKTIKILSSNEDDETND